MTAASALALACALILWPRPRGQRARTRGIRLPPLSSPVLLSAAAAVLVIALMPTVTGAVVGGLAAAGVFWWLRRSRRRSTDDSVHRRRELPSVIELAALMLDAGAPPAQAIATAARARGAQCAEAFERVHRLIQMGEDQTQAWRACRADPLLQPIATSAIRSADSGARLAGAWRRAAHQVRSEIRLGADVAARRVAVKALAPLGLCFLPSFVCVGIIPIVMGLAGDVLR